MYLYRKLHVTSILAENFSLVLTPYPPISHTHPLCTADKTFETIEILYKSAVVFRSTSIVIRAIFMLSIPKQFQSKKNLHICRYAKQSHIQ